MAVPILDVATVAGAASYVANQVIDMVKPAILNKIPAEVKELVARVVTLGVTALCALGFGFGAEQLGMVEAGGMWLVFLATFPAVGGWYQLESRRKSGKVAAQGKVK